MSKELKVATYNVLHSYNIQKIASNLQKLASEGVNIFALQEVVKEEGSAFIGDELIKALGKNWKIELALCDVKTGLRWGTAIVYNSEKLKLISKKAIPMEKMKHLTLYQFLLSTLIMGGKGVVYPRIFISAKFEYNNKTFLFSSVHPEFFANTSYRIGQLEHFFAERLKARDADYEIICGDFNNIDIFNHKKEYSLIQNVLGQEFIDATRNIPWSVDIFNVSEKYATPFFLKLKSFFPFHLHQKIDYIWVKNLKVVSSKAELLAGSDHMPVVAELQSD